jgi:hypothetical protein
MRIEILYVPGCPNYLPAVEQVERVLSSESLQAEIRSIAVRTDAEARELMFPGSPTIRVNGEDIEPRETSVPSLACRLYDNRSGIPSEELLRIAISDAMRRE